MEGCSELSTCQRILLCNICPPTDVYKFGNEDDPTLLRLCENQKLIRICHSQLDWESIKNNKLWIPPAGAGRE